MPTIRCFAVLDRKAGFYGVPFFLPSVGQAVRAITDLCADPSTMISRHPGDFDLYMLAEWDDITGLFTEHRPAVHLAGAEALMPRPSNSEE